MFPEALYFPQSLLIRQITGCAVFLGSACAPALANQTVASEPLEVFLDKHCFECHDDISTKGELNLLDLEFNPGDPENFAQWEHVFDRVQRGEMPPEDEPRPDVADRDAMLAWVGERLTEVDREHQSETGRVQFRRLNRVEYEYTLQDLLQAPGLDVKEMLPPDAEAHGFDNVGEALRVSYVQMARYLDAANAALTEAAWLAPDIQSFDFRLPFPEIRRFQITSDLTRINGQAVLLRQPNTAQTPWRLDGIQIPFPGEHTIRIRGRGVTYVQEEGVEEGQGRLEAAQMPHVLSIYQGTRILGSIDLTKEQKTREITAWLNPGEQIVLYVPTLRDWNPKWKKDAYTGPAVALEWVEIAGPADSRVPKASYTAMFGDLPVKEWTEASGVRQPPEMGEPKHPKRYPMLEFQDKRTRYHIVPEEPLADARRLLESFMARAFRRPFPAEEVDRYLALVEEELARAKPFQDAMITGYSAALTSPDFLYFREESGPLDDHALASRLSYFLWRSLPDEELRALADAGKLREGDHLLQQFDRMLVDPKFDRFVEDFTGQWLELREIRATQPDDKLYPEFDDFLLESMVRETQTFFRAMVQDNLPAHSVVNSDFVYVNQVMADLYGLEGVEGVDLRRVELPRDSERGGILTQASILKVTANGTTTSPVVRGSWVLEHLLGTPAPPPPPEVPAIEPDTRGATTVRELLVKHRADPACATCHAMIDPPGFALESFDVIGGWRENYRSLELGEKVHATVDTIPVSYRTGPDVDPSATMAGGGVFEDIHGFRELLLKDKRQIARNLAHRFIVYGTGAGISFADRTEVEAILNRTEANDYAVQDLLREIVQSDLFLNK